ncbi:MAG TPA: M15 family metallopeptidase [Bacteroidales bacterium]|nr:M15 family metallopeptidase [Bacteroidales bacterium]
MLQRLLAIILFLHSLAAVAQDARNPYNLPLVTTIDGYLAELGQNDDNRLINLEALIPGLRLDIRYATDANFTGRQIYPYPAAWLRKPAALALEKVQKSLDSLGLALVVYDAYRPYAATLKFYQVYPDTRFVADPAKGSRHNRGAAVDVGLVRKSDGSLLPMPTDYDHFGKEAFPANNNLPEDVKTNRDLLIRIMQLHGFEVLSSEWWHYDFAGWQQFSLLDLSFAELKRAAKKAGPSIHLNKEISH